MQGQKKANVLPGQVTLEDVEREAGKEQAIEIEVRIPGKELNHFDAKGFLLLSITEESVTTLSYFKHGDLFRLYSSLLKVKKRLEKEDPILGLLGKIQNDRLGLLDPLEDDEEEDV